MKPPSKLIFTSSLTATAILSTHETTGPTNNGSHGSLKIEAEYRGSSCGLLAPGGIEACIANTTAEARAHGLNAIMLDWLSFIVKAGGVVLEALVFDDRFTWGMLLTTLSFTLNALKEDIEDKKMPGFCACDFMVFAKKNVF